MRHLLPIFVFITITIGILSAIMKVNLWKMAVIEILTVAGIASMLWADRARVVIP